MIYGLPYPVYWTVGAVSVGLGLLSIVRRERIVRCLRGWLLRQLRWLRTPAYRRYLAINGWLLFVLGTLLLVLMTTIPAARFWR